MSIEPKYILVGLVAWVIVAWLIAAGLMFIPRFIFKQPIYTIATNATNADIVNAIYSLKDSLKDTIHATMAVGVGILITVMGIGICAIIAVITLK